jgi:hypothetical protein
MCHRLYPFIVLISHFLLLSVLLNLYLFLFSVHIYYICIYVHLLHLLLESTSSTTLCRVRLIYFFKTIPVGNPFFSHIYFNIILNLSKLSRFPFLFAIAPIFWYSNFRYTKPMQTYAFKDISVKQFSDIFIYLTHSTSCQILFNLYPETYAADSSDSKYKKLKKNYLLHII